jgi:formylglycine-generating enzyme required for sulfatase activity
VRYFDLWHGVELKPDERSQLSFDMEPDGYGAVLACAGELPHGLSSLLSTMRRVSARPLGSFSEAHPVLPQRMTPIAPTRRVSAAPDGMIRIPAGRYQFAVKGIEIEGGEVATDVQFPWEDEPHRTHKHTLAVDAFYIDKYPVTNAQFKRFMDASHYKPTDDQNFLRDWKGGTYPEGWANKPVTWVSLEDARAYAAWAGKRLPHEWEWQYAAQGLDGRVYPWGNDWSDANVPVPDRDRTLTPPANVDERTAPSPFGVMDLVGNVWQWTDEFSDEHTRAAVLKGGSHYQPQGSMWYFPQAYRLDQHGKYLLMAPGRDRSGTVGFRCVVDAAP